jgi:hypothetical protein
VGFMHQQREVHNSQRDIGHDIFGIPNWGFGDLIWSLEIPWLRIARQDGKKH